MKLGIKREKIGDILVTDYGADVIVLNEISEILANDLKLLTRFRKSNINVIDLNMLVEIQTEFEDLSIIVSSIRLDNFVAELAKCSRTNAEELIREEFLLIL